MARNVTDDFTGLQCTGPTVSLINVRIDYPDGRYEWVGERGQPLSFQDGITAGKFLQEKYEDITKGVEVAY